MPNVCQNHEINSISICLTARCLPTGINKISLEEKKNSLIYSYGGNTGLQVYVTLQYAIPEYHF